MTGTHNYPSTSTPETNGDWLDALETNYWRVVRVTDVMLQENMQQLDRTPGTAGYPPRLTPEWERLRQDALDSLARLHTARQEQTEFAAFAVDALRALRQQRDNDNTHNQHVGFSPERAR